MSADSMDPNTLLATLYAIIIISLLYTYLLRRRYYKLMNQFPSPVQLPFLGIFHRMLSPRKIITKFHQVIELYNTESVIAFLGTVPVFFTIDPVLLEKIFTSQHMYNKPDIIYGALRDLFGDGIFTATRTKWQRNRKLINPAFRKPVLRYFVPIFNRNTQILKRKLDAMVGNGEQPILDMMQKFTLTAAMETVLGYEMPADAELDDKVVQNYFTVLRSSVFMILANVVHLSGVMKYFGFYKTRDAVFAFVTDLLQKRIERNKRKTDINDNTETDPNATDSMIDLKENRHIFVDEVLKTYDRKLLNWREVIDESNSVIFASFETTATTIFYTLAFLAMHQDVQQRLFEYVKSIFPDKEFDVDFEHADEYDYMNMVVFETLRLVPPVPAIARLVAEDTQLTDDIFLYKGMIIIINILETHLNPKVWGPDAHKYNPEHFSPENVSNRSPYAFLAFSRGLRNCIGGKYAMIAIKVVLFHIIRNYRFTTSFKIEELQFENNIIIRAKRVPHLEVHKRED